MTFSPSCSVSLVSPFTPLSQLASIPPRHLLDTVSYRLSFCCQLDMLQYLTDSSGVLGTKALHLLKCLTTCQCPAPHKAPHGGPFFS